MAHPVKRDPLVFGNLQQSGSEELAGASPLAVNVIVDAAGAVHRRPALTARGDAGSYGWSSVVSEESPIVAIHSTATGRVFAVDEATPFSRIYELAAGQVYNLSTLPETQIVGGRRPIIAETEAMLVIAAGGQPVKVLLNTPAAVSVLGGGPPQGSHVIAHAERLLLNDVRTAKTSTIRYSRVASGSSYAGHEDWQVDIEDLEAAGQFPAAARPDPVVALHENTNEAFVFGSTSLQIFTANPNASDPARDYVFLPANAREFGCSAPYSVIKYDQSFGFVDQYRRIMLTDGRDFQCISQDIQQTLDDIAEWSDVFGYRVTLGPVDALCWGSPTDGRTFVYQVPTKSWSLWQSWDFATANFDFWPVRCTTRVPETGEMLAGGGFGGSNPRGDVFKLSNRVYAETQLTNRSIVARVDTGFVDRGTSGRKLCRALRLTWRGTADHSEEGEARTTMAFVQWRDDGGEWEHQRQVEFSAGSETILRSLGVYRRRQWRVTFWSDNELVLARAEEEYELLAV